MLRMSLMLTLVVSLLTTVSASGLEGSWTAHFNQERPERLQLNLSRNQWNNSGINIRLAGVTGLSHQQMLAAESTPVRFEMRREAGRISFEGSFRNGHGAGQFTFASDPSYVSALKSLGLEPEPRKERSSKEDVLFHLALHDVSTAFIRSMQAEGYTTTLEKYLSMRIFDVTPELVRELRDLGFRDLPADQLIATRIHRVTPAYIREMRAAGWDLTLKELQSSRIHGATPQFAAEMRRLGYDLRHKDLVSFRIHRVTPEYISELRELGYRDLPARTLVSMRIHRVTPKFIRELRSLGYENVPAEKLIKMKIHKIDPEMIRRLDGGR